MYFNTVLKVNNQTQKENIFFELGSNDVSAMKNHERMLCDFTAGPWRKTLAHIVSIGLKE